MISHGVMRAPEEAPTGHEEVCVVSTVSTASAEHYTWGDNADGWWLYKSEALAVIQERMPPNCSEPSHSHQAATQIFFVLDGTLTIELASEQILLRAGEALIVEPTVAHEVRNDAPTPADFLVISAPASHGDVQRPPAPAAPHDQQVERQLFQAAAARATRYLASVRDRRAFPAVEDLQALRELGGPMSDTATDPAEVLDLLDRIGSRATVANSGGRYFGFVNGGSLPVARAAMVLAAAWDQNSALRVMSPVAAVLEDVSLDWLVDLLDLPHDSAGAFVTGATMANLTCLASARHAVLARAGWDVEADGLFGAPPVTVVVGEEAHVSVLKALALLGLGRDRVVQVPTDEQGRIRPELLPPLDASTIVCVQAGNVNSGACDPFTEICDATAGSGAWVHVDGAFGLWAATSPQLAPLIRGVARADSWATDAHKWLNVPYDCGLAFVRHRAALHSAMRVQAAYLMPGASREPMHWSPEASRRARAVEVWAVLRTLGRSGVRALIERTCWHAQRFAQGLTAAGYAVLNDVVLNQVLVAFKDDRHTQRVIETVQLDGTCWCGGTMWKGRAAMRISVSSWATTDRDVDVSLAAIIRAAQSI
jgi:glutamate/tyrosine decarboxylase-like PLP-dependent enzyme/quercetin dioxygenase-like cupin family protein